MNEKTDRLIREQIAERRQARENEPEPDEQQERLCLCQAAYFAGHSHSQRARIIERVLLLQQEDLALLDKALGGIEWARDHGMTGGAMHACISSEIAEGPGFMERIWRKHNAEGYGPQPRADHQQAEEG